ncbi:MAG: hypothetical protein AAFV98_19805 [Chloroflexota bacterium]
MTKEKPSDSDFLSFRELKPEKSYPSECIASGLSVYTKIEGVRRLQARIPRFRKMNVARGNLNKTHGKMKNTPSQLHESHHTWWLESNCTPWAFFEILNDEDDT